MRKIKEVLRLRFELGLGLRQIARSCSISRATVTDYLQRAEEASLGWSLPEGCDEEQLEKKLFRRPAAEPTLRRVSISQISSPNQINTCRTKQQMSGRRYMMLHERQT
jgi:transposase